jgi:hypothetical protein
VPDLVDLTDDADILPSASRAPARGAPSALSALPVTTVLDDDAGGLYNSEEDEDFDPSILDFDEDEEDNSDASTVDSDGESGENEVIELSDSDSDASDRDDAVAPLVGMPAHRLSGKTAHPYPITLVFPTSLTHLCNDIYRRDGVVPRLRQLPRQAAGVGRPQLLPRHL